MKNEVTVIIAEDDSGHATLIKKNLRRAGIRNEIIHFMNGQETLDFFFRKGEGEKRKINTSYLLLLDIKMPGVDGVEVLHQMKKDRELRKIPVIVVTTTDDPREVAHCHDLGCSNYIVKPVNYEKFVGAIQQLGLFLTIVQFPKINGV